MAAFRSIALLFVLAACTPSRQVVPPAHRERIVTDFPQSDGRLVQVETWNEANIQTIFVDAPADRVWTALQEVHQALEIPVNTIDTETRIAGIREFRLRKLAGKRPSAYFECGSGIRGRYADLYDVHATVLTQVIPTSEGDSEVRTMVEAIARSPAHGASPVTCRSSKELEKEIEAGIRSRVAATSSGR